ncbi:pyridoxal phosphate-dependent decarboxylase family protein [Thermoactinospora rubra]|uniref:pyridoxal phosphate-dependent decarboxylase family protein n=1 Tax=Thermoactinospora rubra TaxID=1088767 RepID=UPI000A10F854|nr:pyridoxal-dependent decarboxylase [Thermoactinospora rubra]
MSGRAEFMAVLRDVVEDYFGWREACLGGAADPGGPGFPGGPDAGALVRELSKRLARESTPWPSPLYLAHMTGDTPPAVALAYLCALLYNPNNVAEESSPVTTELEREVGEDLCRLVGYDPATGWAHLASGGHAASYEAVWIARNLRALPLAAAADPAARDLVAGIPRVSLANLPVPRILDLLDALAARGVRPARRGGGTLLFARNAHQTWRKCADLLGVAAEEVETDEHHRMDLRDLRRRVVDLVGRGRPVVAVVATVGSTGEGSVDDLAGVIRLREWCERRYGASFYVHADAAFGGYYRSLCLGDEPPQEEILKPHVREAFAALPLADSVTVDPHKTGCVPYPAGGLALRDRRASAVVATRSGYFREATPAGHYTLEGARPGAAAAAVWAAHRLIGLHARGYGRLLGGCLDTARRLHRRFPAPGGLVSAYDPDLTIVNLAGGQKVVGRALAALRADGRLWVSANGPAVRLCVMKELDPPRLDHVCRLLREAARACGPPVPGSTPR